MPPSATVTGNVHVEIHVDARGAVMNVNHMTSAVNRAERAFHRLSRRVTLMESFKQLIPFRGTIVTFTKALISMFGVLAAWNTTIMPIEVGLRVLHDTLQRGVELIGKYQEQVLALQAIIATKLTSSADPAENFLKAGKIATAVYKQLLERNAESIASLEETAMVFQTMLSSGAERFVGNMQEMVDLSILLSNAIAAITPGQNRTLQLAQETRDLISGQYRAQSMLTKFLFKSKQEFMEFREATQRTTDSMIQGFTSSINLVEDFKDNMGFVNATFYDTQDILSAIVGMLESKQFGNFAELKESVLDVSDGYQQVAEYIRATTGDNSLADFVEANQQVLYDIFSFINKTSPAGVLASVRDIAGEVVGLKEQLEAGVPIAEWFNQQGARMVRVASDAAQTSVYTEQITKRLQAFNIAAKDLGATFSGLRATADSILTIFAQSALGPMVGRTQQFLVQAFSDLLGPLRPRLEALGRTVGAVLETIVNRIMEHLGITKIGLAETFTFVENNIGKVRDIAINVIDLIKGFIDVFFPFLEAMKPIILALITLLKILAGAIVVAAMLLAKALAWLSENFASVFKYTDVLLEVLVGIGKESNSVAEAIAMIGDTIIYAEEQMGNPWGRSYFGSLGKALVALSGEDGIVNSLKRAIKLKAIFDKTDAKFGIGDQEAPKEIGMITTAMREFADVAGGIGKSLEDVIKALQSPLLNFDIFRFRSDAETQFNAIKMAYADMAAANAGEIMDLTKVSMDQVARVPNATQLLYQIKNFSNTLSEELQQAKKAIEVHERARSGEYSIIKSMFDVEDIKDIIKSFEPLEQRLRQLYMAAINMRNDLLKQGYDPEEDKILLDLNAAIEILKTDLDTIGDIYDKASKKIYEGLARTQEEFMQQIKDAWMKSYAEWLLKMASDQNTFGNSFIGFWKGIYVMFKELGKDFANVIGQNIASSLTKMFETGESFGKAFLDSMRNFLGQLLIMLGEAAVQAGTVGMLWGLVVQDYKMVAEGAMLIAGGMAAIALGSLLTTQSGTKTSSAGSGSGAGGSNPAFAFNQALIDMNMGTAIKDLSVATQNLNATVNGLTSMSPGALVKTGTNQNGGLIPMLNNSLASNPVGSRQLSANLAGSGSSGGM